MKRFSCPVCETEVHFDNSECLTCRTRLALEGSSRTFRAAPLKGSKDSPKTCENRAIAGCNWLVAKDSEEFCEACMHNRTVPDNASKANVANWREIERAKRYLFYSILKWKLPHPTREEAPKSGLAFDFLADHTDAEGKVKRVLTGHDNGLITVNIAEGNDAEREARRTAMGEPYRTLIGHFRHEVGHFYWNLLVRDGGKLEECRMVFGDERTDYGDALKRHYANGPRAGWRDSFISSYAASHPWEDFAETWAHYIHIVDASETAHAFGLSLRAKNLKSETVAVTSDPYQGGSLKELLDDWVPLTVALNCLNRSIGQPEMYPFVLSEPVRGKLAFIHELIGAGPWGARA